MRIKILENDEFKLAYFPDSLKFFEINNTTKNLILDYIENEAGINFQDYQLSEEEGKSFLNKIEAASGQKVEEKIVRVDQRKNILNRLVLNVSNDCNLNCTYCYANGGSYLSESSVMSIDTARDALLKFYKQYESIDIIQIFGGEPLMNMPVIQFICEFISQGFEKGDISRLPTIGVVTNGTLINRKFIELTQKYGIKVTISLDGPPMVNDAMRMFSNGKGTSDIITSNIKELKKETGEPNTIEVTFNKAHITNNVRIIDIIDYVNENFENTALHIVPVSCSKEASFSLNDFTPFIDSVDDILTRKSKPGGSHVTYSLFQRIIEGLYKKQVSPYVCEAGFGTLSVSVEGDIYPCFMFTDEKSFHLGTIHDENVFESELFKTFTSGFLDYNKFKTESCKGCFVNTLCNGCMGENYLETGDIYETEPSHCYMLKEMTSKVILGMANAKRNQQKKEVFS